MQLLRGATIVAAQEVEPDALSVVIDARGQLLQSTFVIEDRNVRQRLLEIYHKRRETLCSQDDHHRRSRRQSNRLRGGTFGSARERTTALSLAYDSHGTQAADSRVRQVIV